MTNLSDAAQALLDTDPQWLKQPGSLVITTSTSKRGSYEAIACFYIPDDGEVRNFQMLGFKAGTWEAVENSDGSDN